ncbi:MAG TPA: hypothetical protein VMT64_07325 [Candidatus Binataceae bacterium]|nr:hypothetical protein [Candidatus Binataceae bacterium]
MTSGEQKGRGAMLTILAICLALIALSNFSKPLKMSPNVGFVFLGMKLSGIANLIIAPIFGVLLAALAYGILAMRRFALPIAYFYAAYVIVNLTLFTLRSYGTTNMPPLGFWIIYILIAVGVSSGAAILLTQRRAELV